MVTKLGPNRAPRVESTCPSMKIVISASQTLPSLDLFSLQTIENRMQQAKQGEPETRGSRLPGTEMPKSMGVFDPTGTPGAPTGTPHWFRNCHSFFTLGWTQHTGVIYVILLRISVSLRVRCMGFCHNQNSLEVPLLQICRPPVWLRASSLQVPSVLIFTATWPVNKNPPGFVGLLAMHSRVCIFLFHPKVPI
jgi:hypothetical protein